MEAQPPWRNTWRQTRFSLAEARKALPYVARVVVDASAAYHEIQDARLELMLRVHPARRAVLNARRDASLRRLDAAIDECDAVGVDLMDIAEGVVRFNAEIDGQIVSLYWRLGEPLDDRWTAPDREPQAVN